VVEVDRIDPDSFREVDKIDSHHVLLGKGDKAALKKSHLLWEVSCA
jgi:hypothetical protein